MKTLLLALLMLTSASIAQAQFENVSTKTIDKQVDRIDRDVTLQNTEIVLGDTILSYLRKDNTTYKITETIKTDSSIIKWNFYYNNGAPIFVFETQRYKRNGKLALTLFSQSYFSKGVRIYNTCKTSNNTTQTNPTPTIDLIGIAAKRLKQLP